MSNTADELILIWEAPVIVPPEFRLYYDGETGKVICYTCEKLEGTYIVIDATTYAQARPDIRVIDGRISSVSNNCVVSKLMPSIVHGQLCEKEDISVITDDITLGVRWKLKTYEIM